MKKAIGYSFFILTMLTGVAHADQSGTPLEQAQQQVIQLQQDKIALIQKLSKEYVSRGICFRDKGDCIKEQGELNNSFAHFSNSEFSLRASCQVEGSEPNTICAGSRYVLRTTLKISPN